MVDSKGIRDEVGKKMDALQRSFNPYTPEVHARNMALLRMVWNHLAFLDENQAWYEGETRWGTVFAWNGDEHPLSEGGDFCLRLPDGFRPLIEGVRGKPQSDDDGIRGTIIATPWVLRHEIDEIPTDCISEEMSAELSNAMRHLQVASNRIIEYRRSPRLSIPADRDGF